jgi:hypothetical protein
MFTLNGLLTVILDIRIRRESKRNVAQSVQFKSEMTGKLRLPFADTRQLNGVKLIDLDLKK